jgi:hypothetical protein
MKTWQMEYKNGYPWASIRFTVLAENFAEAVRKGNEVIDSLKRTATYEIHAKQEKES